jgi:hypothetical protein
MWWFTPREERTMARRLKTRRAIAQQLSRDADIPRLAENNARLIANASNKTREDETVFETLYGEPMPAVLRSALHLETEIWTLLHNNQHDPQRQRRLAIINQLLTLEREILHTPLTKRYETTLDRLRKELKTGR